MALLPSHSLFMHTPDFSDLIRHTCILIIGNQYSRVWGKGTRGDSDVRKNFFTEGWLGIGMAAWALVELLSLELKRRVDVAHCLGLDLVGCWMVAPDDLKSFFLSMWFYDSTLCVCVCLSLSVCRQQSKTRKRILSSKLNAVTNNNMTSKQQQLGNFKGTGVL